MPDEVYELISRGARYWFLFLMVLVVWRSMSWYLKDKKTYRKHIRFLPDAGSIGRLEIIHGEDINKIGLSFPVRREGTIGTSRMNDIRITGKGIQTIHLRFHFEEKIGLLIEKANENAFAMMDGNLLSDYPVCMLHESILNLGEVELQLLLFEGFECFGLSEEEIKPAEQYDTVEKTPAFSYAPQRQSPKPTKRRRGQ